MPTTPEQQLALELINLARADPAGQFDLMIANAATQTATDADVTQAIRYFDVDLALFQAQMAGFAPVAPLAWSDPLAQSADTHSNLMIALDTQAHYLPGEGSLIERMTAAGYDNIRQVAENIYAYSESVFYAHAGFVIDWGGTAATGGMQDPAGHRNTILNPIYTEVGISWTAEADPATAVGPYVTTQHFGTTWDYEPQLLGVVIDDLDGDDFYDIGEGLGGVTITATGSAGTFVTTSWDSGGYQMALPDGIYTLTFSGGGLGGTITRTVTIDGENVKVDAIADEATGGLRLVGDDTNERLSGGTGDDTLLGGAGRDTILGGTGRDSIEGGRHDDQLDGGDGNDLLFGDGGKDTIDGGDGDDTLIGGLHKDDLYGGSGRDSLEGGGADDTLNGAGGKDTVRGGNGDDILEGRAHRDTLRGGGGHDTLLGGGSADRLFGGGGRDSLDGGAHDDRLVGGRHDDTLVGGGGADTFVFDQGHDADVIADFDVGEDILLIKERHADGLDAAGIVDLAQVTGQGVLIDFGRGDTVLLDGVYSLSGLQDAIEIV